MKQRMKKGKKIAVIAVPTVCIIITFIIVLSTVIIPSNKYNFAFELMNDRKYSEAAEAFGNLADYKESANMVKECNYQSAVALLNAGKYEDAITVFEQLHDYNDSEGMVKECKYQLAVSLVSDGKYDEAISTFETLDDYKNSANLVKECKYQSAVAQMKNGKYAEAESIFEALDDYGGSANRLTECRYQIANIYAQNGEYLKAISAFEELGSYKDSAEQIKVCRYQCALSHIDAGNIIEAYEMLTLIKDYKDSRDKASAIYDRYKKEKWKSAKVGNSIFFGSYEQDNILSNGKEDLEWLVLDIQDGKALVISKYAFDDEQYHTTTSVGSTWETCALRQWLNGEFLQSSFTASERAMINTVTVPAEKNPQYKVDPGNSTQDKIFVLSISEVNKYFASDNERKCEPTKYGYYTCGISAPNGTCQWWLRNPGMSAAYAATVGHNGDVVMWGTYVTNSCAVRPAMWVDLNAFDNE